MSALLDAYYLPFNSTIFPMPASAIIRNDLPAPQIPCYNAQVAGVDPSCAAILPSLSPNQPGSTISVLHGNGSTPDIANLTMSNAAQLIMAAIRLDLGNVFPNNLLASPNTLNSTIARPPPEYQYGNLYDLLSKGVTAYPNETMVQDANWIVLNTTLPDPAIIATQFLCHVAQRKPLGQAVISVLVATLSIFTTGWGLVMLASTLYESWKYGEGVRF